jgi:hypothetical protein
MDFREMAIYMLLEAFDAGPLVSFVLDAYSAGCFHIVTAEVPNAVFRPRLSRHAKLSATTDAPDPQYDQEYRKNPVAFIETCLLVWILGLEDCHRDNFCAGSTNSTIPGTSTLQIIDFVPPNCRIDIRTPHRRDVVEWIRRSDLLPESAFPLDESQLQQAFNSLNAKFSQLRPRAIPIAVYPPLAYQHTSSLPDLLDDAKRGEMIIPVRDPVTCSKFVRFIETQIRNLFFDSRQPEFGDRTLGALFGFSDLDRIWNREHFNAAVAAAVKSRPTCQVWEFDDFLKEVIVHLKKEHSIREQEVEKVSVNYALAQLRWFSIWLDLRVSSIVTCFASEGARGT